MIRSVVNGATPGNAEGVVGQLQALRTLCGDNPATIDRAVVGALVEHRRGLETARRQIAGCQEMLARLSRPPLFPALFLGVVGGTPCSEDRALVQVGGGRRVIVPGEGVDLGTLRRGDDVLVNQEQNLLVGPAPGSGANRCGETALFQRRLPDGRLVLQWHEDSLVVDVAARIAEECFKPGDAVRFDRSSWIAFERIELESGRRYLLEEVPATSVESVGGQRHNLDRLLSVLSVILVQPQRAAAYGLTGRNSVLLCGPPGCGKTLMARAAVSEIARLTGKRCRFGVVKPAEWESPWVGQTQENIRQFFQGLREAGEDGFAVAVLDEVESVGRIRGGAVSHHSDKFLAALLAELDGFSDRRNVAIICATNRKDLLDSALYERLSDLEIAVSRPDLSGARSIFEIHLPGTLPFHPNGPQAERTREELIELAVSRIYSPNGDNELCQIRLRDGSRRTVAARELASGRLFESICRTARRLAFLREIRGGEPGVRAADMETAVGEALDRMRTLLTVHNARSYLPDLPQDIDVVGVDPAGRRGKAARPHLNLAE
jgi:proteasome-associated ATPase